MLKSKLIILCIVLSLTGCDKFKKTTTPKTQNNFMISTLGHTVVGTVKKNLGYYCRLFEFQGKDYTAQLNNAMQGVIQEGTTMGANGLIGLQFTTLPIGEHNNSSNITKTDKNSSSTQENTNISNINSIVQACGDMVIIDN